MIDIKTFAKPKKSAGASGGGSSTTYLVGVATEAEHATRADRAKKADSAERAAVADRATNAQSANYASKAGEVDAEAEVLQKFLRKDRVDDDHVEEVEGKVSFADDVMVNLLRSVDFSEILRRGFGFIKTASGGYRLLVTDLQVWGKAMFDQLEIRKLSSVGGNVVLSAASCKVAEVESIAISSGDAITKGWRCYFLVGEDDTIVENPWMVGDHARCQTYGVRTGSRSYWRKVVAVSTDPVEKNGKRYHYIELSDGEGICTDDPMAGDTLVLDGHEPQDGESDTERTNLIVIESTGSGAPRIVGYSGITRYSHEDTHIVFAISSHDVTLCAESIRILNGNGVAALFTGGKINASLIDADKIEVKHLWAKSNDGASKVGYFGNTEESACKLSDGMLAPLFIGGDTAAKSPFYVTSNGAMHATSGYIGGFSIINDGIISSAAGNEMRINTSYIKFYNEQHGITNIVGANWEYGIDYTAQQIIVKYDHPAKLTYNGSQATANQMNVGLYVSASGTKHQLSRDSWLPNSTNPCGNHAIFCDKGDFAGFRPCFRKITASQTLTKYDVFLEVDGTWKQHNDVTGKDTEVSVGSVTITLPKDPEIGQMYWILRGSKYNYTLKTTDGTLINYPGGKGTSVTLTTNRELVCVIFNGEYWRLIWRIGVV